MLLLWAVMSLLSDFHNFHNLHKTAQWFKLVILYSRCSSGSDLGWDPGSPSELDCRLSRWSLNLQLIIETCRAQSEVSIIHWSPTVLWTMFFFMSLSFFLLTLFSNLWIATGHKSMWIRHLAYFKILATLPDNTYTLCVHCGLSFRPDLYWAGLDDKVWVYLTKHNSQWWWWWWPTTMAGSRCSNKHLELVYGIVVVVCWADICANVRC